MLTGDTILGRGTTVVAHPDGHLGDYLDSLDCCSAYRGIPALPGHGPAAGRLRRRRRLLPGPPPGPARPGPAGGRRGRRHRRRGGRDGLRRRRPLAVVGRRVVGPGPAGVPGADGNPSTGSVGWSTRDLPGVWNRRRAGRAVLPQLWRRAAGRRDAAGGRAPGGHGALRRPVRLHLLVGGPRPGTRRRGHRPGARRAGRRGEDVRRARRQAHRRRDHGGLRRAGRARGRRRAGRPRRAVDAAGGPPGARRRAGRRRAARAARRAEHRRRDRRHPGRHRVHGHRRHRQHRRPARRRRRRRRRLRGARTAAATRHVASWRALRPLRLKGKREPVEAYELLGLLDAPGHPVRPRRRGALRRPGDRDRPGRRPARRGDRPRRAPGAADDRRGRASASPGSPPRWNGSPPATTSAPAGTPRTPAPGCSRCAAPRSASGAGSRPWPTWSGRRSACPTTPPPRSPARPSRSACAGSASGSARTGDAAAGRHRPAAGPARLRRAARPARPGRPRREWPRAARPPTPRRCRTRSPTCSPRSPRRRPLVVVVDDLHDATAGDHRRARRHPVPARRPGAGAAARPARAGAYRRGADPGRRRRGARAAAAARRRRGPAAHHLPRRRAGCRRPTPTGCSPPPRATRSTWPSWSPC